ncbi:MAG TPA: GNAT family N-acetyltransferase [Stellaceae bacterium]|nr:GNAT family N-acetyltransferase [Stellaceae bacterium]
MRIVLRPATPDDAERLLAWRNDPVTRAHSRRQHALSWAELMAAPAGTTRESYVGELDGHPVGSLHLDYAGTACELSWTVAPAERGRGIGRALVAAAVAAARAPELVALIKPANEASRRIADSLGFAPQGERDGLEIWRLTRRARA